MRFLILFFNLLFSLGFGQLSNEDFIDKDFDTNKNVIKAINEIDSLSIDFNFKIEKQFQIKILLKNISFYENMIKELNRENDPLIIKGLIKSIIISDENLKIIIKETDSVY